MPAVTFKNKLCFFEVTVFGNADFLRRLLIILFIKGNIFNKFRCLCRRLPCFGNYSFFYVKILFITIKSEDLMKKIFVFFCMAFLLTFGAFSEGSEESEVNREQDYALRMNEPGDQYINIGLMVTFPLNFGGNFPLYRDGKLSTGGAGTLGYHRFLNSWFSVGIDISFGYHPTIQHNMFTYVPFTLCATVQPSWRKFEFPITLGVGAAVETYLSSTYFPGLVLKPQAGVFYRINPSWSFGVRGDFMILPQWYSNSDYNYIGKFASGMISARYHF